MRARAGWCEVKSSEPGVASLFRHCCKPDLCPGGATSNAFAYFAKADMALSMIREGTDDMKIARQSSMAGRLCRDRGQGRGTYLPSSRTPISACAVAAGRTYRLSGDLDWGLFLEREDLDAREVAGLSPA